MSPAVIIAKGMGLLLLCIGWVLGVAWATESSLSCSASHLMEVANSSVLVVPRGVTLPFGRVPEPLTA